MIKSKTRTRYRVCRQSQNDLQLAKGGGYKTFRQANHAKRVETDLQGLWETEKEEVEKGQEKRFLRELGD